MDYWNEFDQYDECQFWFYMNGMEKEEPVFGYENQCVITTGEWVENPWEYDMHAYYQMYNDLDLACFYIPEDDYEVCYPYFRVGDGNKWEFSAGGAWIWTECDEYDVSYHWDCYGGEWSVNPSDFSFSSEYWSDSWSSDWSDSWSDSSWSYYSWDDYYYWGSWYDYYWDDYYWDDMYYYDRRDRGGRDRMGALKNALSGVSLAVLAYVSM